MKAPKLNYGEWGELYAFLRLTGDGRVQMSDAHEKKLDGSSLEILSVIRHESLDRTVSYQEEREPSGERNIIVSVNGAPASEVGAEKFSDKADELLALVQQGLHAPFPVSEEIAGFLVDVQVEHFKARSQDKSDIFLDISDSRAGVVRKDVGYSIKTKWSKKSTLFNTGAGSGSRYKRLFGGFCGRDSGIGPAQRAKTTIWN
ncbi:HpaII family restriction endonuclease [Parafannyhessea umbonata]|uniref:HpaII family restriction endonuclease n=1 Tax=Parafannyhessea umbonata TaxID=604330 RepID=UPI0026EFF1DC|nr:HpaII family restriction endonuclease [Parafannyhessea umbonata]MDD7199333.1 HpaII family restriction endonuclease [Parafannyhessea umbonata]